MQLPSTNHDIDLKAYLSNGEQIVSKRVNPNYNNGTYTISVNGTSGTQKLSVELDDQLFAEFTLNFDTKRIDRSDYYTYMAVSYTHLRMLTPEELEKIK